MSGLLIDGHTVTRCLLSAITTIGSRRRNDPLGQRITLPANDGSCGASNLRNRRMRRRRNWWSGATWGRRYGTRSWQIHADARDNSAKGKARSATAS